MFHQKQKNGFTLIELLIVIGIIAVLSAVALFMLSSATNKGNDSAKIEDLQQVQKALQLYFTDNGYYPTGSSYTDLITALVPKYIPSINPNIKYQSTDITNTIVCSSDCASYHLGIALSSTANAVLTSAKHINVGFNGQADNCVSGSIGPSNPDLCYDVTP